MFYSTRLMVLACALTLAPSAARATNGMNAISYGPTATGMAGADIAVGADSSSMNVNPAGIALHTRRADAAFHLLVPSLTLNDSAAGGVLHLNKDVSSETAVFPMFDLGVIYGGHDGFAVGLGFFSQGGMGAEFKDLKSFADRNPTVTGNPRAPGSMELFEYQTKSMVSYFKFTPTLAYRSKIESVEVAVGVSGNVGFAKMDWDHGGMQFPEMDGDNMFAAHTVDFNSYFSFVTGARAGLLVSLLDNMISIGASGSATSDFNFTGTTRIDNLVDYDTNVEGFGWASDLGIGLALRPISKLLVAADYRRVFWEDALNVVTFTNTAYTPAPPGYETVVMPFEVRWVDQDVFALGAQYDVLQNVTVRAGYNWGNSPVRRNAINPLFPAVTEHHLTAGVGVGELVENLIITAAFEYAFNNTVTSNGKNQLAREPAMPGAASVGNGYEVEIGMKQMTFHLGAGYLF